MLNAIWEILKNPFSFVFQYFISSYSVVGILVSAIMLSILALPFYFLGKLIFENAKGAEFRKVLYTSFLMSVISSATIGIWSLFFNPEYAIGGFFSIISGIITLTVILSLLIELGMKIHSFIQSRWEMPPLLHEFIIILLCSAVFFAVWAAYLSISSLI